MGMVNNIMENLISTILAAVGTTRAAVMVPITMLAAVGRISSVRTSIILKEVSGMEMGSDPHEVTLIISIQSVQIYVKM